MLTLFTIPKAFREHIGLIQRNAITSWTLLHPRPQIILHGSDEGVADVANELDVQHLPEISCNKYGTPLVNDLFEHTRQTHTHDVLCYINADIILMSDFMLAVDQVAQRKDRFLVVGRRWDVDVWEHLDFGLGWERKFKAYVTRRGQLHSHTGIDYFVFSQGIWGEIPPFAIGRTLWDNWLIYRARSQRVTVVDVTPVVMAVHQNHDYKHNPNGKSGVWEGPEAKRNLQLAGGWSHVFTLRDATHLLTQSGLKQCIDQKSVRRYLKRLPILYPHLRLPVNLLLRVLDFSHPVRARLGLKLPSGTSHNC